MIAARLVASARGTGASTGVRTQALFGTIANAQAGKLADDKEGKKDSSEFLSSTTDYLSPSEASVQPVELFEHVCSLGIDFFCGVPDSLLKPFCAVIADTAERHLITANEGSAVATAAGYHLSTGEVPLVYLQNSGLGNAVNPIMSLAHREVYATPMVLVIGWRGCPGHKDEPQHVVQGRQTVKQLESLSIDILVLPNNTAAAKDTFTEAVAAAKRTSQPVALLVPPSTFLGYKKTGAPEAPAGLAAAVAKMPTREQAIRVTLEDLVGPDDAVVCTTGFTSREVYELRANLGQNHDQDFLCVGSMGHALAIAQGIASAQPDRTVWCLDGDGATLMHMGNMASSGALARSVGNGLCNLRHIVLNNRVHDSVGAQPTAASFEGAVDFPAMALAAGYASSASASTAAEIRTTVDDALSSSPDGPLFLNVDLNLGTRSDLGRPKTTTLEAKKALMSFLAK